MSVIVLAIGKIFGHSQRGVPTKKGIQQWLEQVEALY
jgi:hypothetical protein